MRGLNHIPMTKRKILPKIEYFLEKEDENLGMFWIHQGLNSLFEHKKYAAKIQKKKVPKCPFQVILGPFLAVDCFQLSACLSTAIILILHLFTVRSFPIPNFQDKANIGSMGEFCDHILKRTSKSPLMSIWRHFLMLV